MGTVDARKVRAVRPRICTVCRRTINAGDLYHRYTEVDDYGARIIHKSCLEHDDDDPDTDTPTSAMKRLTISELEKMYPPRDPEDPDFEPDADKPQEMGTDDPAAESYAGHPLAAPNYMGTGLSAEQLEAAVEAAYPVATTEFGMPYEASVRDYSDRERLRAADEWCELQNKEALRKVLIEAFRKVRNG